MSVLFGAFLYKSPTKETNFDDSVIGKNSEVFTAGDFVTTAGGAGLVVALVDDPILGVAVRALTMASNNATVAKVKPFFEPIDQDYEFLMGTNADLTPLTSPGTVYDIIGTTGIQQVDVTGGAGTQVLCTRVDPRGLGGTGAGSGLREGLFKVVLRVNP